MTKIWDRFVIESRTVQGRVTDSAGSSHGRVVKASARKCSRGSSG